MGWLDVHGCCLLLTNAGRFHVVKGLSVAGLLQPTSQLHCIECTVTSSSFKAHQTCVLTCLAGLLTLRQVADDPPPGLQDRLSPRKSCSNTKATAPRTFSTVEAWPEFLEGSAELYNSLDDSEHKYNKPGLLRIDPAKERFWPPAADEAEVRGCVVTFVQSANDLAELLDIQVECMGGGSGRSTSFTDLVVRRAGLLSNPASLSSSVLGTGEVKGIWQFRLRRGERLEDALSDPKKIDRILQPLQQVSTCERPIASAHATHPHNMAQC